MVQLDGHSKINYGLFGVAGRDNAKIMVKQNELIGRGLNTLITCLRKGYDFQGNKWTSNGEFVDLFDQMLCMHPDRRISPEEILEHVFLEPGYGGEDSAN